MSHSVTKLYHILMVKEEMTKNLKCFVVNLKNEKQLNPIVLNHKTMVVGVNYKKHV